MSNNTEALKLAPCPFCGHETPYFERMGTPRQSCIVVCGDCGARHESSDEGERSGSRWNTRAALAQAEQPEPCAWSQDDEGSDTWHTSCRHMFTYTEGGPTDNHAKFCCYCGKPISEHKWGEDHAEE